MDESRDWDREVERLLEWATAEPVPEPPLDLVQRSVQAVRRLIVLGDMLRFATLEALWQRSSPSTSPVTSLRAEAGETEPPDFH